MEPQNINPNDPPEHQPLAPRTPVITPDTPQANQPGVPIAQATSQYSATPQMSFSQADALKIENSKKSKKTLYKVALSLTAVALLIVGIALFLAMSKAGSPDDTSTWKNYSNSQAGFSADFIKKPKYESLSSGDLYLSKSSDNQNEYTVGIAKGTTDVNALLEGQVKALINGVVESRNETMIDGNKATDVTFSGVYKGQKENFTARIITKNNNLYQAYTIGYGRPAINSEYFINHFKLLK